MATKIRKRQIETSEFIIPSTDTPTWITETETASQKAIADKITALIQGVTGAMIFAGAWADVQALGVGVKKGYTYVYNGSGTAPTGVVLENGDLLIANTDTPDPTASADWTVVQTNIDGALTVSNLGTTLVAGSNITITLNSSTLKYTIAATPTYPTVSNPTGSGYVTGFTITNGVITLTRSALPTPTDYGAKVMLDQPATGTVDGSNTVFVTPEACKGVNQAAIFVNGLRQKRGVDYTASLSATGIVTFTLSSGAYIPVSGDYVTCDYVKA